MENNTESLILGSGDLFYMVFEGTIPEDSVIEDDANVLGYVQSGATIEYKPEFYTAQDDFGRVSKTIVTKEEATLKSGICTWNGNTLKALSTTARVTEKEGKRTVKIGGVQNSDGKSYIIRFLHKDDQDGDIRLTIVGTNQSGFSLAFAKDKETVIDAEFAAQPCDKEGTLIIYEETMPTAAPTGTEAQEG